MQTKDIFISILLLINIQLISSTRLADNDFFTIEARNLVKKINRLSVSLENEPILNILLKRFKEYIFNHEIDRPGVPKEKYNNLTLLKYNFTKDDDGTYDIYSHENIYLYEGYQVSFETTYDDYTSKDYDEICYKLSLMSDNTVYLGVWEGDAEFSFYFEDFDLANAVSILFNQYSIWDWSKMQSIDNKFHKEYY
jgi:hypothetical protein